MVDKVDMLPQTGTHAYRRSEENCACQEKLRQEGNEIGTFEKMARPTNVWEATLALPPASIRTTNKQDCKNANMDNLGWWN